MSAHRIELTLAHSGDPDDVFMWWPITGKALPDGSKVSEPAIDTGRFRFRAVPGDIADFNRLARAHAPYDITALSVRAYADVAQRYDITGCGSSFGVGYGPKLVVRKEDASRGLELLREPCTVAVPGLTTSAVLTMQLMLRAMGLPKPAMVEAPFTGIIPMVASGAARVGLVIHEGQLTFPDAGLVLLQDLGAWWAAHTGLPLPLGVNAIKRDLDDRFGPGTQREVVGLLHASLAHALAHSEESLDATMPFAIENARVSGTPAPTIDRVREYVGMYVAPLTVQMGEAGKAAIIRFLAEGAAAGLCPPVEVLVVE